MKPLPALVLALIAPTQAFAQSGDVVRFISCPVYRDADAGRKSGCWLATDPASGVRYDVTLSPTKPDWNFAVLVEGRVADEQDNACGGLVLTPARVSILTDACPRHMLPAEDYPGRAFVLPERNVRPLAEDIPAPQGPYEDRQFNIFFDFDRDFVIYQYGDYLLDQAIRWIRAADPKAITITGYAATLPAEVSGQEIAERPRIARARAERIAEALRLAGIDPDLIEVRAETAAGVADLADADGLAEASRRRVEISVRM